MQKLGGPLAELIDATFPRLQAGELEVAYGFAAQASRPYREQMQAAFTCMNAS